MMRIRSIVLLGITTLWCVSLASCLDDAASQHAKAAKAIDTAANQLDMLSPDPDAASQGAKQVLNTLRSVDVQSGPLASVKSALSAKAKLVLGQASIEQGRAARRKVAQLGGRIEARLLSLQRLQSFAQNAPFTPRQLGVDALERGLDDRSARRRQNEDQLDAVQQQIDQLTMRRDQDARDIAESRNISHEQRLAALQKGNTSAIPELEHAGASLASLAPLETRLEHLGMDIAALKDQRRQLQLVVDGDTSTIEAIQAESADLRGFMSQRSRQVDSVRDRIQTLQRDLLMDASALASAETGTLHDTATAAMAHFEAAASDAQRAARQAGQNAMADRVLELAARQSALTTSVSRFMSLNRNASLLDRLANQGDLDDAAALRDQARSLASQRDDAMETARTAAQNASAIADQLGDGERAQAIRSRLGSMHDLLDGKPIAVPERMAAAPAPTTPTSPPGADDTGAAPPAALAAATGFLKANMLAAVGDTAAAVQAKDLSNCTTTPGICEGIDLASQMLPAMADLNAIAATTFTGPEAMGIQQIQAMLNPQAMQAMIAPMLDMLTPTGSTHDGDTASVQFQLGPGAGVSITVGMTDGTWLVTGGTTPQGQLGSAESVAAATSMLDQIAALRTQIESGQISSAMVYMQKMQDMGSAMQAMSGLGQ